ncbi:uncharacterized protein PFB0145c [Solenopsis invicta]|uniref:uncharacterized protein PFB0145c n=1 Tax=Solenopsis invicta TaxID=13686 RepID=UPI000E33D720|nr:uncharacterized protein PFB0145c [Solenopsis invicta]XP_025993321.1 uncharacterized protein PFB0145c [Solenopsis invicta]XP_025993322.1 uncharacterized protein PFB0145c [Solenopsis invicta]XP_039304782.1 uncharacterized protein PFB0145c [Solenopsis invicta]XP_039304783.1 uncharacterized protein PFB0145c [Solenopsis invicta]XP_039304784.1 uncharacterized protein PFB0145c [Solenopsis invicta]XP_039304785.1 uncharacterized protein PFB0145c [Solenopsis invicta]XP_039304786.1 uncharacterized p
MSIQGIEKVNTQAETAQCLPKLYNIYKKLKIKNTSLTEALSKEKQNSQAFLAQNVQLMEQIQKLKVAYNTRNTVISNVLNNAKEVQKMLDIMTKYTTNTIFICQKELDASNIDVKLSSSVSVKKDLSNKMSRKSPVKDVVKPMVNEYTKPIINLSQINMENINNISKLSDIQQEVITPTKSPKINETRSPITSLSSIPLNYKNDGTYRLPERLTISSSRDNETNKQKLKRKRGNCHLVSDNDKTPSSTKHYEIIDITSEESDDDTIVLDKINAESQFINEESKTHTDASRKDNVQLNNRVSTKKFRWNASMTKKSKLSQNNTRTCEKKGLQKDPKSLFNNITSLQDELEKLKSSVTKSNKEISKATQNTQGEEKSPQEDLKSLSNNIIPLQDELEKLESSVTKNNKEISKATQNTQGEEKSPQEDLKSLFNNITSLQHKLEKLKSSVMKSNKEISKATQNTQGEEKSPQEDLKSLSNNIISLQDELEKLESSVTKNNKEISKAMQNTQGEEKSPQENPKSLSNNIMPPQDELEKLESNVTKSNKEISKTIQNTQGEEKSPQEDPKSLSNNIMPPQDELKKLESNVTKSSKEISKTIQNTQGEEKGPQEDPKSLFNNFMSMQDNEPEKLESSVTESNKEILEATDMPSSEKDAAPITESNSYQKAGINIGELLPAATASNYERTLDDPKDVTVKKKNENDRTYRLPVRLTNSSSQDNAMDKQELQRKKVRYFSRRLASASLSPAQRTMYETLSSAEYIEQIDLTNDDDTPHELSDRINVESQSVKEENEMHADVSEKDNVQINSKVPNKNFRDWNKNKPKNSKLSQNNIQEEEKGPQEESPKLFNKTMPSQDNEPKKLESSVTLGNKEISKATDVSERDAVPIADDSGSDSNSSCHKAGINIGKLLSIATATNRERSSNSKDSVIQIESDTELMIPKNTNITVLKPSTNESDYFNIMIKLPLISFNDHKKTSTLDKTKHSNISVKKTNTKVQMSPAKNSSTISEAKWKNIRDPSKVKVLLEKLDKSIPKPRSTIPKIQPQKRRSMKIIET